VTSTLKKEVQRHPHLILDSLVFELICDVSGGLLRERAVPRSRLRVRCGQERLPGKSSRITKIKTNKSSGVQFICCDIGREKKLSTKQNIDHNCIHDKIQSLGKKLDSYEGKSVISHYKELRNLFLALVILSSGRNIRVTKI